MHVLPECQRRGKKHRTTVEKVFKRLNTLIIAAHFGCFLIVVSQIAISAKKTMDNDFWFGGNFAFNTIIESKTANCSQMQVQDIAGFNGWEQEISFHDREFKFAEFASELRFTIGVNAAALVLGGINKVCFDINLFALRFRHIRIRKDLVTTLEFMFIVMSFIATAGLEAKGERLQSYLQFCGLESKSSIPYLPPLTALFVGLSITAFFHVVTLLIMLKHALKKQSKKPDAEDGGAAAHQNMMATYQQQAPQFHSLSQSNRYSVGR